MDRPEFKDIKNYQEFSKYYWYRDELIDLCKKLKLPYPGTKAELLSYIKAYYSSEKVIKKKPVKVKKTVDEVTLDTPLLACGFCFSQAFREFFSLQTGVEKFKFNTDMVATVKKVKETQDETFTLRDLLDVYYGKLEYAHYDSSSCQWNLFLKEFCCDEASNQFRDKLKVGAILWGIVRDRPGDKIYHHSLIEENYEQIKDYLR